MASEISRRFPDVELAQASTLKELGELPVRADDLMLIDATHEEAGFDGASLLHELRNARAIVLTSEGVLDTLLPRSAARPATLAALMALVGEALGASSAHVGRDGSHAKAWRDLTPREREVASLLLQGKSNKEIANELCLSDNTVKMHLTQIMRRLHVTNRTQVVLLLGAGRENRNAQATGDQRPAGIRPAEADFAEKAAALPGSDWLAP